MSSAAFDKYCRRHPALPLLPENPAAGRFRDAVVIPVCDENDALPDTLASLAMQPMPPDAMIVLVINHPADAPASRRRANALLAARLRSIPQKLPLFRLELEFPAGAGGVGHARKAGLDSVLPHLASDGLLFSLDADTTVETNYLDAVRQAFAAHREWAGAVIRFRHPSPDDPALAQAIREYEGYLDAYVAGLAAAGSPYAYHTMGSAMVCRADAYVRAGGMRARAGGEDFYFLQALRKTGPIGEIDTTTVHPAARPSDRVPFGTGPRLREIVAGKALDDCPPEAFAELKLLLEAVRRGDPEDYGTALPLLSEAIGKFLQAQGFPAAWAGILRNTPKTEAARRGAFHCWFDAFRTLKFIHSMVYWENI